MAKIILTPDYILMNFTENHLNTFGIVTLNTVDIKYDGIVEAAINDMGIGYNKLLIGDDSNPLYIQAEFTFNLVDIQYDCPVLYAELQA